MNEEQKKSYIERYLQAKQKGVKFWPDIIYKDLIVSFAFFLLLIGLATFIGVAREPRADPSDSSYIPRPEWYFLFLFKFLALYGQIPVLGKIEFIAAIIIPVIVLGVLTVLPFIENLKRVGIDAIKQAILVAAVASEAPPALLEQLGEGGRLLMPLRGGGRSETLVRITRSATGAPAEELLPGGGAHHVAGQVRDVAELLEHLLDERLLDAQELLLVEEHARDDLEARADHAALVGGAVLDSDDIGVF